MNNDKYLQLRDSYLSCMSIEETCEEVPLAFFISPIFENRHFLVQVVVVSLDLKIELGSCQSQMLSHITPTTQRNFKTDCEMLQICTNLKFHGQQKRSNAHFACHFS